MTQATARSRAPLDDICAHSYRRRGKSGPTLYDREEGITTSELMRR